MTKPDPCARLRSMFPEVSEELPTGWDEYVQTERVARKLGLTERELRLGLTGAQWFRIGPLSWMGRYTADLVTLRTFEELDENGRPLLVIDAEIF